MSTPDINRDEPIDPKLEDFATAFDTSLASGHTLPETPAADAGQQQLFEYARRSLLTLERAFPRESSRAALNLVTGRGNVGKFEIRRELGRGGSGIVFLAFDTEAQREVALKLPRWDNLLDPAARQRFLDEARLTLRLEHPGIVRVYEAGEIGAVAFIASEYAGETTLADWRESRISPIPSRLAAQIVAHLAAATAYLHAQNLIHRDIKPQNVILQTSSTNRPQPAELLGVGIPKLTDFGFATLSRPESQGIVVAGTPEYMSPEQALGQEDQIGPPTDVFALSVILYELITGHTPFHGRNKFDTVQRMLNEAPRRFRHYRSDVPRDLEAICLKGLARQSFRRYATAHELHQDLQAFLSGERPAAHAESGWRQLVRSSAQRPLLTMLMAFLFVAIFVSVLAYTTWRRQHEQQQAEAMIQKLLASDEEQLWPIVQKLRNSGTTTLENVVRKFEQEDATRLHRFRLALAAAESSPAVQEFLADQVLISTPQEFRLILEAWDEPPRAVVEKWQRVFQSPFAHSSTRLRAGLSLTRLGECDSSCRAELIQFVLSEPHPQIPGWVPTLQRLLPEFTARIRTDIPPHHPSRASLAYAILLAEFHADQLSELIEDLRSAMPVQLPYYVAKLRRFGPEALAACRLQLSQLQHMPNAAQVATSKLRANLICAMSHLGEPQILAEHLHAAVDPSERYRILHMLADSGQGLSQLLTMAQQTQDAGTLYALLIALGEYPVTRIPPGMQTAASAWLRQVATSHPDAGVHAAARWLTRTWFGEALPVPRVPFQEARTRQLQWYVAQPSLEMVFLPGQPRLAVSSHEITSALFQRFLSESAAKAAPEWRDYWQSHRANSEPSRANYPVAHVSYLDAAAFCNWLTQHEFGPGAEAPYTITANASLPLSRVEYRRPRTPHFRLPTEREWETACSGGTATKHYFGDDSEFIARHAWTLENSGAQAHPVGQLAPNPFGLHDVLGNVQEWCMNNEELAGESRHPTRGGSWQSRADACTTRERPKVPFLNHLHTSSLGFRVVCWFGEP